MKKLIAAVLAVCVTGMIFGMKAEAGGMEKKIKAREVVEQLYLDCLGRKATADEINYYIKLLEQGKSGGEVRKGIIMSDECKNAINKICKEVQGSQASEKQLNKAREMLANGKTLQHIRNKLQKQ